MARVSPQNHQPNQPLRVALFLEDMGFYGEQAVQAIAQFGRAQGNWSLSMASFGEVQAEDLATGAIHGVMIGRWADRKRVIAAIDASGVPAVAISGNHEKWEAPCSVAPDDRGVGATAAQHFLDRGFQHFAFYGLPVCLDVQWAILRQTGFVETVESRGYTCSVFEGSATGWGELHDQLRLREIGQWLLGLPRPTALFCCIDMFAYELLRLTREARICVPQEIAVCGVDNRGWICTLASPTISSIPLNGAQAGAAAASLLHSVMVGVDVPEKALLIPPLPIVQRESTDIYAFHRSNGATLRRHRMFMM